MNVKAEHRVQNGNGFCPNIVNIKKGFGLIKKKVEVPTQNVPLSLPKTVDSLCPECLSRISATIYEEGGKIWMKKKCEKHGEFKDLIYSNAELYKKIEQWTFEDAPGLNKWIVNNPECNLNCGLCNNHLSVGCQVTIDLTNRCNLNCPICFANANKTGKVFELTKEQIDLTLDNLDKIDPKPGVVMWAGGEPTVHPHFLYACEQAKKKGIGYILVATNGIAIANSLEFAKKAKEAGADCLYLQFDGIGDKYYIGTRGKPLWETKKKAIENCRKSGLKVVLVPTVVKNVNGDQVGPILDFAIKNSDVIVGISYQPVSITGRIKYEERMKMRETISDVCDDIEEYTHGLLKTMRDWYPLAMASPISKLLARLYGHFILRPSCHSNCGLGTYLLIDPEGNPFPVTKFIDFEGFFTELNEYQKKIKTKTKFKALSALKAFQLMKKYYKKEEAPNGMSFLKMLRILDNLIGPSSKAVPYEQREWKMMLIMSMQFQDSYCFNFDRIKRCNIHYSAPDGKLYPFCTYNSGPCYREKVESNFRVPLNEWKKRAAQNAKK
ncbi:radical SAM protein [Candidatus Woesearchaeota archaeon]|nr:radical SAM protein [Candidatus Woesearchaeota archaeon]